MADWLEYQSKLYHFNSTATEGQVGAERDCQQIGGHLVSITSKGIENFIDQKIEEQNITESVPCLWIGLENVTGDWKWANGENLSHENWWQTEPNNLETQKCANKHIQGIYNATKPWFNEYCDDDSQSCGKICQRTTDEVTVVTATQSRAMTDVGVRWTTFINEMTTTSNESNKLSDSNSVMFAILLPTLILVLVVFGVLLFCVHGRKKKYPSEPQPSTENLENNVDVLEEKEIPTFSHNNGCLKHAQSDDSSMQMEIVIQHEYVDTFNDDGSVSSNTAHSPESPLNATDQQKHGEFGEPVVLSSLKVQESESIES